MKENINKKAEKFKTTICEIINNNKLPACLTYYILKDLLIKLEQQYYFILGQEEKQQQGEED